MIHMGPPTDSVLADAAEEILDLFERQWSSGHPPSISEFFRQCEQRIAEVDRPRFLMELVAIDLWRRWTSRSSTTPSSTNAFPEQPLSPAKHCLEDYARLLPELTPFEQLPPFLVCEEYRVRLLHADAVSMADYRRRFPGRPELYAELGRLERQLADARVNNSAIVPESTRRSQSLVRTPSCPNCHALLDGATVRLDGSSSCSSCGYSIRVRREAGSWPQAGCRINQFELLACLGSGGFGTVWKARDTKLQRDVAIKIPRRGDLDAAEVALFMREAQSAAQLRHPQIVAVHEVGAVEEAPYIVSELVDGVPLSDRLRDYSFRQSAELCAQVAEALHHAHEAGVVHRDLKPANIMIDAGGRPHLLDFGLARRVGAEATLSEQGMILGTPAYMSPEQASGQSQQVDRRTDVYSLGVILFQLLAEELPFRGNANMMMMQIIKYDAPSPREFVGGVPRDLETICLKCLEKKPAGRYATAADLADDLRRYLRGAPIAARPISRMERTWKLCRANPLAASLVALVVTFLGALSLVLALWNVESSRNAAFIRASYDVALGTLEDVVHNVQRALEEVPGAASVRTQILDRAMHSVDRLAQGDDRFETDDQTALTAHLNLGRLFLSLGAPDRAIVESREAIARGRALLMKHPADGRVQHELSEAWEILGEGLTRTGDAAQARQAYEQAAQSLAALNPPPKTKNLGRLYNRLTLLCLDLRDLPSAERFIGRAFALRDQYNLQDELGYGRDAWESLLYRGDVGMFGEDYDAAEHDYRAALQMAEHGDTLSSEELATGLSSESLDALRIRDAATACERLATLLLYRLRVDDVDEAEQLYENALHICKQRVERDPQDSEDQRQLAAVHERLGRMWLGLLRPDDAAPHFQAARIIREPLSGDSDATGLFGVELLSTYGYLAQVADARCEFEEAIEYCDKSLALWEKLSAEGRLANHSRLLQLSQRLESVRDKAQLKRRIAGGDDQPLIANPDLAVELLAARAIEQGRNDRFLAAEEAIQRLKDIADDDPQALDIAARAYAELSRLADAQDDEAASRLASTALSLLTEAHNQGAYGDAQVLAYFQHCAAFDGLRSDDRFQAFIRQVESQSAGEEKNPRRNDESTDLKS